ncbi:VOC family protein [Streptomyces calidiresistens]|uniref:VOC family protein n=1 Tax=Streptomyces calidiresistens TaxID=1485586 RepID=A0A7W3XYA9_9ACTN|nr:VOC family protein [Streptomyces calidiresistens]MBB0231651.1 VOC family protein [Streptomyces calidiresistens]
MTESVSGPTPGIPCFVSVMMHDLPAGRRFYGELLGWEFEAGPEMLGPYLNAKVGGRPVAGLGGMAPGRRHPVDWVPFFSTADADSTMDRVRECGGTPAVGPMDVERAGRVALAADPMGAVFGVWQAGVEHGTPFSTRPGSPVWTELVTVESSMVSKFYSLVFDDEPRPEQRDGGAGRAGRPGGTHAAGAAGEPGDYVVLYHNDRPVAGIHGVGATGLPPGHGACWVTYFAVADPEEAAERVTRLGGRVLGPVSRAPFGDFVRATDPEGAPFGLVRPSDPASPPAGG